jgi:hypothetical protein
MTRKAVLLIVFTAFFSVFLLAQTRNTKVFTIFTSGGCGCTGSGGPPETFMTHEQVTEKLQEACEDIDFEVFEGSITDAYREVDGNKESYDGVLLIGRVDSDYRLAFTGLPTIVVYNMWEFQSGHHYHIFNTGKVKSEGENILAGGINYENVKVLTAQLDRRNLSDPAVTKKMFDDLVYKVKLIKAVKEMDDTRILMVKRSRDEIIASVNYKHGDYNQDYPPDHNERLIESVEKFGAEVISVEPEEFYEAYKNTNVSDAEKVADKWVSEANEVLASRPEIIKNARAYLALESLREKYNCNAISTHIRSVSGSGKLEDLFNPGLGLELGFKPRGIMAVCQNYPHIVLTQMLAFALTGRPSMLGDQMYDVDNGTEIVLHCGIPVNPYGGEWHVPYAIVPHAESPVRDKPEEPGSSTGLRAYWPEGEPVTFWEIHTQLGQIRMHTGEIVDGHEIYTGGENTDHVMCTAKIIAKVDNIRKVRDQHFPSLYGIHHCATLGDLRQQIKDIGILLGLDVVERDK